jgi:hypothetical protein
MPGVLTVQRLSDANAVPAVARSANILIATPLEFVPPGMWTGCTVDFDLDSITGTSITFTLVGYNETTDDWYQLLSTAAVAAPGNVSLTISPITPPAANAALCRALPGRLGLITSGTWSAALFGADIIYF